MAWIGLYTKIVARMLILVYLLIGAGLGSALFLCEESEAFSHITYKMSGNCQTDSPRVAGCRDQEVSTPQPTSVLFSEADCRDTQLSFSHLPDRAKKLLADPVTPDLALAPLFASENSPVTAQEKSNLVAQLPPLQALAALRTVVLLN